MSEVSMTQLSPLSFLDRSARVYPDKVAIVDGNRRTTYREFAAEANRVARALQAVGVRPGDRVAYLMPNTPELLIAHFAVPLAGAVLVALNTRLSASDIAYVLDHSGAAVLVADGPSLGRLDTSTGSLGSVREVFAVHDPDAPSSTGGAVSSAVPTYADLLERGSDESLPWTVEDENAMISISYTSGTTGRPKGAMYTHRGAYLNSLGEMLHSRLTPESVYLWTLPMFHCNGWCRTWAVTGAGGAHVCLRSVRAEPIWRLLEEERVTHLDGAPTVLHTITRSSLARPLGRTLVVTVAGAPPSPTIIARLSELGARTVHVYGLTETYGPYSVNEWQEEWSRLPADERSRLQARQGVGMVQTERLRVVDEAMVDVPADGATMGEIVMRGNNVMTGYYADPEATQEAFRGGWFHSGDLGVTHPDGYVELRDRAADLVISGGENISSVEVEQAVESHPGVLEVAVVGVPDETWGERPKAFVVLRQRVAVSEGELLEYTRSQLAHYKAPRTIEFVVALPRNATGKIQKAALRDKEWAGHLSRVSG